MDIVYFKDYIQGTWRLDWSYKGSFNKTFVDNTGLFENRKNSLYVAPEDSALLGIDEVVNKGLDTEYTVSFSLLLFNREDFEDLVFPNETIESIIKLKHNIETTDSTILNFIAIPNSSFISLEDYKTLNHNE